MTAICMECFICHSQACRLQGGGSSDLSTQLKTGVWHAAHKEVYRQSGSSLEILSTFENMETTSQPPVPSFPLPIIPILPPPPRNEETARPGWCCPHLAKENVKKIKEDPSKCQPDVELLEKNPFLNSSVCHKDLGDLVLQVKAFDCDPGMLPVSDSYLANKLKVLPIFTVNTWLGSTRKKKIQLDNTGPD